MKKAILVISLIFLTVCINAQAPDWQWASQAGGIDYDEGYGIAIDENGNSYVTGTFEDTAIFGSYSLTSSGYDDIFVAKMDANGDWLWASQADGSFSDESYAITIDENGNSYVTGLFMDTTTFGSYSLTSSGEYDVFVAKIDANGNWLWASQAGGSFSDESYAITIDENGNSYVTGFFVYTATFGSYSLTSSGESDIFVAKLDASGNWLWATQAGGNDLDEGNAIAIDDDNNCYIAGVFGGTITFGSFSLTSNGYQDIYIAKMDASSNWLWATKAIVSNYDNINEIKIDENGNSYVTGCFQGTASFGSFSLASNGFADIFIAKMDTNGNWLWVTNAGGWSHDVAYSIAIDDNTNSYITGRFANTATFGSFSLTSNGSTDIFVAKMDSNGNWIWVTKAGGNESDFGYGIALDDYGICYVTGCFKDTANFGPHSLTSSGESDIFVAKLGNNSSVENDIISTKMELSNYPNPFNPTTTISFSIQNDAEVELTIYNIKGQKIVTLVSNQFPKDTHSIIWNGDDESGKAVSSGIYLYQLNVNGKTEVMKKCLLLK